MKLSQFKMPELNIPKGNTKDFNIKGYFKKLFRFNKVKFNMLSPTNSFTIELTFNLKELFLDFNLFNIKNKKDLKEKIDEQIIFQTKQQIKKLVENNYENYLVSFANDPFIKDIRTVLIRQIQINELKKEVIQ